ncbi:MAG: hypothetical protein L6Q31_10220 [Fimbriimonadaceae bacterium]|nr:hypothetical protein [Fimbriimonadaceae bacterium]
MRVWYPRLSSTEEIARLREWVGEGVELFGGEPGPPEYEVLVDGWPNAERLEASSVLRSVIVPFTGVPPETLTLLRQRPRLSLHNIHHSGPETAEMALALMFAVCKRIVPMDRLLRKGDWSPRWDDAQSLRLEGKRALVLGYGGIGRRIAKACVALGMKVTAMRNRPELGADAPVSVVSFQNLAEALACAEVLHIALPLTPRTEGMIGERELAALPKGTILINVARAKIVDERPLFEALASGHLGGAGLDVWYRYPKPGERVSPSDYPFEILDNVVLSPHRGGSSTEVESHRFEHIAKLLRQAGQGEAMENRIDPEMGY